MPCTNITELMRVVLDDHDRLVQYRFIKHTCGAGVGADSYILDAVAGKSIDDLLLLDADTFCDQHPASDEIETFLMLKHLFALQSLLAAYSGQTSGGKGEECVISGIGYEDGATIVDAEIPVDVLTEKIRACGRCEGCGTKRAERKGKGRLRALKEEAARTPLPESSAPHFEV